MKGQLLIAITLAALSTAAHGADVRFTVDPNQSSLTVSGTYPGPFSQLNIVEQIPAGFTTTYSGTIDATANTAANTLLITGGNVIANVGGNYQPPTDLNMQVPKPNSGAPADYGFYTNDDFDPIDTKVIDAVRSFAFSPTSSLISAPGDFNSSQLSATITAGELDYAVITTTLNVVPRLSGERDGSTPLAADQLGFAAGAASLAVSNNLQTLTVPFRRGFDLSDNQALLYCAQIVRRQ
jgi:hypothetical protein